MYRLEKGGYLRFLVSKGRAAQARVHLVPVAWYGAQDHDGDRLGSAQPEAPFAGLGDLTRLVLTVQRSLNRLVLK